MDRRKALTLGLALLGCSQPARPRVGAKNFVEQDILGVILGELIARYLAVDPELRLRLGGSLIAHSALINGDLDLYPEYSGTALTSCLKLPLVKGEAEVYARVRDAYQERYQVTWGWPLGFSNNFALVARAGESSIATLTEAVHSPRPWRLGVGYEFEQRPDGWAAMRQVYPLPLAGDLVTMDLGLLFRALDSKQVDLIAANSTDPQLASGRYTLLRDDKNFFPPYQTCLAVRNEALTRFPKLRAALDSLAGRIDETTMRKLNASVALDKRSAEDVARAFAQTL